MSFKTLPDPARNVILLRLKPDGGARGRVQIKKVLGRVLGGPGRMIGNCRSGLDGSRCVGPLRVGNRKRTFKDQINPKRQTAFPPIGDHRALNFRACAFALDRRPATSSTVTRHEHGASLRCLLITRTDLPCVWPSHCLRLRGPNEPRSGWGLSLMRRALLSALRS